jgi:hypothetical protein
MESRVLFKALAARNYHQLADLYALNARDAIVAFLSVQSRWSSSPGRCHAGTNVSAHL